ncbi:MAG: chromosome segregation protein SMC, partial [Hymenobacter sp.]
PELGLHPDVIVSVGKLIKEASTRTQLIVTTHSRILIDCFQDSPEDVVVVNKENDGTHMERLDPKKLSAYLDTYSLSSLWSSGDIGGNRW